MANNELNLKDEYQYGFKDEDVSIYKTPKGLSEDIVREISKQKGEPDWMLEFRLKCYRHFISTPLPSFGPDLSSLNFNDYTYFIRTMMADTMEYIEEHKSLVLIENLFVIGYLAIMLIPLIFTKVKIKLTDLAMMGGLLFMSFLSIRHIALLAVIGMFYLCRLICNIGKIKSDKPLDYNLPWYGILIVTITIAGTSIFVYNINYKEEFINTNIYPVTMVDYIKENLDMDKVRLYNEYDFGSYLMYKDIPVFIDSRSDLYTKSFNHKTDIFNECMKITEHYGRIFKKYEITHILIYKDTYLNQILAISSNYKLVHRTGRFMLYEYTPNIKETKEA